MLILIHYFVGLQLLKDVFENITVVVENETN